MVKQLRDIVGKKSKPNWARSKEASEFVNKNPQKIKNDPGSEHEKNFTADYVPVYDRSAHHQGVDPVSEGKVVKKKLKPKSLKPTKKMCDSADKLVKEEELPLEEGRIGKLVRKATGGQRRNIIRKSEDASKAAYKEGRTDDAYKHARRAAKAGKDVHEGIGRFLDKVSGAQKKRVTAKAVAKANTWKRVKNDFLPHKDSSPIMKKGYLDAARGQFKNEKRASFTSDPKGWKKDFAPGHYMTGGKNTTDRLKRLSDHIRGYKKTDVAEGEVVQFPKKKKELPKPGTKENKDRFRKTLPEDIDCYKPMKTKFGKPTKKVTKNG